MTTRVSRMSKRRRKIAWLRFLRAEVRKEYHAEFARGPIAYNAAGLKRIHRATERVLMRHAFEQGQQAGLVL